MARLKRRDEDEMWEATIRALGEEGAGDPSGGGWARQRDREVARKQREADARWARINRPLPGSPEMVEMRAKRAEEKARAEAAAIDAFGRADHIKRNKEPRSLVNYYTPESAPPVIDQSQTPASTPGTRGTLTVQDFSRRASPAPAPRSSMFTPDESALLEWGRRQRALGMAVDPEAQKLETQAAMAGQDPMAGMAWQRHDVPMSQREGWASTPETPQAESRGTSLSRQAEQLKQPSVAEQVASKAAHMKKYRTRNIQETLDTREATTQVQDRAALLDRRIAESKAKQAQFPAEREAQANLGKDAYFLTRFLPALFGARQSEPDWNYPSRGSRRPAGQLQQHAPAEDWSGILEWLMPRLRPSAGAGTSRRGVLGSLPRI